MRRSMTLLAAMVAMTLVAAAPALAQPVDEQNGTGSKATLTFEVDTEGQISEDTTFFGLYGGSDGGLTPLQLADPDGDGTYSGSVSLNSGQEYTVQIIQGTGTEVSAPAFGNVTVPGEPRQTLKGPQTITLDGDRTISASYSGTGNTDDQYEDGVAQVENVTLSFELATEGECSSKTTFFAESDAVRVADDAVPQRLTDPDGNGVYTVSAQYPVGTQLEDVRIVRGTGVNDVPFQSGTFEAPGEPVTVVKDFGSLTLQEDTSLSASFSCAGEESQPESTQSENTQPSPPAPENQPEEPGTGTAIEVLPDTGGVSAIILGAGALLVAGGLAARRIFR